AGFLPGGVLRYLYPNCRRPESQRRSWPEDQGVREITALAACAQSYLTIIGAPEETVSNVTASTATTRTESRTQGREATEFEGNRERRAGSEGKGDTGSEQVKRARPAGARHPGNDRNRCEPRTKHRLGWARDCSSICWGLSPPVSRCAATSSRSCAGG